MPGFWQKSAKYQLPEDFSISLVMEIVYLASCSKAVQYIHVSSQGVSYLSIHILPWFVLGCVAKWLVVRHRTFSKIDFECHHRSQICVGLS
jgi:hypothetical protein